VPTDHKCIRLEVDADPRLAAAVGGATRYLADGAGLEDAAISQLQAAIVAACREAFEHLTGDHPHLHVALNRFDDRLEIALAYSGEEIPAVGLDTIAGFATERVGGGSPAAVLRGVDRVQYETVGGKAVTRLTKYLGRAPHIA
jgi:hypothetical protein